MVDVEHKPGPEDFDESAEDFRLVRDLESPEVFEPALLPCSEPMSIFPPRGSVQEWREKVSLGIPTWGSLDMSAYYSMPAAHPWATPGTSEEGASSTTGELVGLLLRPEESGFPHESGWVPKLLQLQRAGSASPALAEGEWKGKGKGKGKPAAAVDAAKFILECYYEQTLYGADEFAHPHATSSAASSSSRTGTGTSSRLVAGSGSCSSSGSTPKKPRATIFGDAHEFVDPFASTDAYEWSDVYYRPSQRSRAHGGESVGSRRWVARDGGGVSAL
ncbi:hypothetical protein C8Q80DRAFT_1271040 [Daedaleopsis nitida]|nr:hypothetical protein C8Q80DRAFT_1271040 [Daedaleopsis nitida]